MLWYVFSPDFLAADGLLADGLVAGRLDFASAEVVVKMEPVIRSVMPTITIGKFILFAFNIVDFLYYASTPTFSVQRFLERGKG